MARRAESRDDAVTSMFEQPTAIAFDSIGDDVVVPREGCAHDVWLVRPPPSGAFNIGHEEGHGSDRTADHITQSTSPDERLSTNLTRAYTTIWASGNVGIAIMAARFAFGRRDPSRRKNVHLPPSETSKISGAGGTGCWPLTARRSSAAGVRNPSPAEDPAAKQ